MRKASRALPRALPKSLMQRLALLEYGLRPVSAARQVRPAAPSSKPRTLRTGACFGIGFAAGGALAALLVFLLPAAPGNSRDVSEVSDTLSPARESVAVAPAPAGHGA